MTEEIDGVEPDENDVLSADQVEGEEADQTTDETEGEEGEAKPEPKPKKTAQDRINELTRKAREAEREREYWREAALNGSKAPQPRQSAQEQPRDEAPNPDDFTHGDADPNYLVALAEHRAVTRIRMEYEARDQAQRLTASRSTFDEKVAQLFPDGEPEGLSALRTLPAIRSEITDVIFTSDKGPLIAEHLGDNPSALRRLESLPAHLVGFELARIEQALSAPPPPNRVTKAPDPAPKPRGQGGQFAVSPDTNDFAAFERLADKVRSS